MAESKLEKHAILEQEIKELAAELKSFRSAAEAEKESLKAAVKSYTEQTSPAQAAPLSVKPSGPKTQILPKYLDTAPEETKLAVEELLDLAWHKGIKKAAEEAKRAGPLILDAFHDALTDKLYEEFKKRKLIR